MLSWMCSFRSVGSVVLGVASVIASAGWAHAGGPPIPCDDFDASPSLPSGWTSTTTGTGGSGWSVVNNSSNSAPRAVFANDPPTISSQFLTLPAFGATGNVTLDFWARVELEDEFDGLVVEASINGGAFTNIGDAAFTLNGYTDTISANFSSEIGGQRAFSGAPGVWTQHTATIPAVTGDSVVVRFRVATDTSVSATGVWLDDVCLSNSVAPVECCWENGSFDQVTGQASHLGGAVPNGTKAADDFYLCEGFIHDLSTITATLLTTTTQTANNTFVKPKAEIWSDCNGCPDRLLYTFDKPLVVETGNTFGVAFDGRPLRIVNVTFDVSRETIIGNRDVVLKGGTYWLSIYGQTDGLGPTMQMYDITYWGTTGNGRSSVVKGKAAYKIDGTPNSTYNQFNFPTGCGPTAWHSVVDDCCVGCTDLNYTLCAPACKILIDNGEGRRQPTGTLDVVGSTSQYAVGTFSAAETRSADDFVVPPCQDYRICYIEGCVLTNCPTFDGAFEIYGNDCNKPSYALHGSPLITGPLATKIIDLGYSAILDGRSVRAYKLEFHDLNFNLTGGRQYWISIGVKYTFSIVERAFFCYNADCDRSCLIRWNNGKVLTATTIEAGTVNTPGWANTGNDFSFLIAADGLSTAGPIAATPACRADYNIDGVLNSQDVFDYLTAWFTGCP